MYSIGKRHNMRPTSVGISNLGICNRSAEHEIATRAAYKAHLETPHFMKHKTGTLHMVKSLHLASMQPLDPANMNLIFKKEKQQ